ncbi:MAG TPA: hypothetical protein VEU62_03425 [Bryobacterales bacterium]|nr:hypothetical protein [Bryobacterales bacterium]
MIFALASFLIIAVLAVTLVIRQKDLPEPEPVSPTAHLEERKKAIYDNLRDLQFEYRMGKLSDQDYAESKLDLQRQLAVVLAEIEKIGGKTPGAAPGASVAARAGADGAGGVAADGAAAPEAGKQQAVSVCPQCAAEFAQPMKFCGECGAPMAVTS